MSFNLGKFKGVPIRIHWSFSLLFVGIVIAVTAMDGVTSGILWGLGIIALFLSVLIHEFMHSYAAYRFGSPTEEIVLYPLGGASKIKEIPTEPKQEFLVAVVGPITNFVIAGLTGLVLLVLGSFDFTILGRSFRGLIEYYAVLNLSLGLFNMFVPALPMDGGRLLRSILNTQMPFPEATKLAVRVSNVIAITMAFIGLFWNVWLVFIALFLYITSSSEMEESITRYMLENVPLSEVVHHDLDYVNASQSVDELISLMLESGDLSYLVKDDKGNDIGVVTLDDIRQAPSSQYGQIPVQEIMRQEIHTMNLDHTAKDALIELQNNEIGRLYVKDGGQIIGEITRSEIITYLKISTVRSKSNKESMKLPPNLQKAVSA